MTFISVCNFSDIKERTSPSVADKVVQSEVQLAEWCPTRDLIALVVDNDQLEVFRMELQSLWRVTSSGHIRCLSWNRQGKFLCAGLANYLVIYAAETGNVLYNIKEEVVTDYPLIHLSWLAIDTSTDLNLQSQRFQKVFPSGEDEKMSVKLEDDLNVICCGHEKGQISFFLYAQLFGGMVSLEEEGRKLQQVQISQDMKQCTVVCTEQTDTHFSLHTLDISAFTRLTTSFKTISLNVLCIHKLVGQMESKLNELDREWTAKFKQFQDFLQNVELHKLFGICRDPESAAQSYRLLFHTLIFPENLSITEFPVSMDTQIKTISKAVDSSLDLICHSIRNDCINNLQKIDYLFNEILGHAQCGVNSTYVSMQEMQDFLKKCSILRVHFESSLNYVTRVRSQYRMFLTWLLWAKRQFKGEQGNEDVTATDVQFDVEQLVEFVQGPMCENFFDQLLERCQLQDCKKMLEIINRYNFYQSSILEKQIVDGGDDEITNVRNFEPQGLLYQIERLIEGLSRVRRVLACYFDDKIPILHSIDFNSGGSGIFMPITQFKLAPYEFDQKNIFSCNSNFKQCQHQWVAVHVRDFQFDPNFNEAILMVKISSTNFQDQNQAQIQNTNNQSTAPPQNEILQQVLKIFEVTSVVEGEGLQNFSVSAYMLGVQKGLYVSDFQMYKDNLMVFVVHGWDNQGCYDDCHRSYLMKVSLNLNDVSVLDGGTIQSTPNWLMLASAQNQINHNDVSTEVQIWPFDSSSDEIVCGVNSARGLVFVVAEKRRVLVMDLTGDEEE